MKRIQHILWAATTAIFAMSWLTSCIYDEADTPDAPAETICVGVAEVSRTSGNRLSENGDNKFEVLFWFDEHIANLENPTNANGDNTLTEPPYLSCEAPQSVAYYERSVFDTEYPYPDPMDKKLYATGYAPSNIIEASENYTTLTVNIPAEQKSQKVGRYDFLGCDFWRVYNGSLDNPFAQEKNRLYFRHLAAKLVFYADRDDQTMEGKQYVRNVQIKNLRMKVGDAEWTANDRMYTPSTFKWTKLDPDQDFTAAYKKVLDEVKELEGNGDVTGYPTAGYKILASEPFAGIDGGFVLQRNPVDLIPSRGIVIDSCYVCNRFVDGSVITGKIQLRMDISAELSFDLGFPTGTDDNSIVTYAHEWKDVTLDAINEVSVDANGNVTETDNAVTEFKPGMEYRVYLHFNRTGVNLIAEELPWNYGGVHYITINGGSAGK